MRYLKNETFGQRYGIDPTDLVLWLDQSDPRSYGDVGNWYDLSGQGNHGTQAVGANQPAITGAVGLAGSCRSFDGVAGFLSVPNSASLDIEVNLSVSVWIKVATLGTDTILERVSAAGGNPGWDLITRDPNDRVEFWVGDGVNGWVVGSVNINNGLWHHIAGVYDGTDAILYIDGVVDVSGARTADLDNAENLGIGGPKIGTGYFDGFISNAALHNRALTAAEIQRMYLVDKPRYGGF